MGQPPDLERLYQEAQTALGAKDFERARGLLKQVLLVDENYRDASKLLAGLVEQQRRRWYGDWRLWGIVGAIVIVVMGVILIAKLPSQSSAPTQPLIITTSISTLIPASHTPSSTPKIPSPTPSAMPTSIPLVWERLWMGEKLARDNITAIVIDPTDPDILYVGTQHAGIYKSINGGSSWQPVQLGLARAWIHSIVIDPVDPRTLYTSVSTGGVYKTTDGGENWFAVNEGIVDFGWDGAGSLALDPQDSQHLLFTALNGLFETRNGGEKWTMIIDSHYRGCFLSVKFHPLNSQIIYAAPRFSDSSEDKSQGGISKSEDGGRTWEGIGLEGVKTHDRQHQIFDIDQQSGNLLYVTSNEGIFASRDGGGTWEILNEDYCSSIAVSPDDGNVVYCGSGGRILITDDGGIAWRSIEENFSSIGESSAIAVSPQNAQVLFLGGQGVLASNDGGDTWEERSSGLGAGLIELTLDPLDASALYLDQRGSGFLYRSLDNGQSWALLYSGARDLALDSNGEFLYRLEWESGLLRSANQGQSWEVVPWPMDGGTFAIAAHPKQSRWVYVTYGRDTPPYLFLSKDGGDNWEGVQGIESIFDGRLYFDHDLGDVVYVFGDVDAFRSEDSGRTWERCENLIGWNSQNYSRLVVDPRDSNHLILATRGEGLSVSEDGCRSWQSSNDGLGSLFINTIAYDPKEPDTLYAGGDSGAYVSFDGGQSWGEINDGLLGATVVYSIVVDSESNVYAATPYGIFKLKVR